MRTLSRVRLLVSVLLSAVVVSAAEDPSPIIRYPASADYLLVDLSPGGPRNAEGDSAFTRIYGDGRVHVHRPSFYRESGDFEAWLTPPALDSLLTHFAAEGLLDFNSKVVMQRRLNAELKRLEDRKTVPGIADAPTTTLTIHLERYAPQESTEPKIDYWQSISWYALDQDVEWYPEIEPLVRLHASVSVLTALTEAVMAAANAGRTTVELPPFQRR